MNHPKFDILSSEETTQIEIRDLITSQLKTAELQSKTSDKQYKISLFLTIAALIISMMPLIKELYFDKETNYNESIIQLTESHTLLTEKVSEKSIYLLDLQNQVQILEKQNEILAKKLSK